MPQPNVLVLRAPGTNCDQETTFAFEQAGGKPQRVHVNRVLENPTLLDGFQALCIPGGFSYGDDLGAGKILASQLQLRLRDSISRFVDQGKLVLGICNGFQVLLKSGILLPDGDAGPPATLTWNESGKFEDRWVRLRCEGSRCVFFAGIERLYLPIAHAEGKFVTRDAALIERLSAAGQLPLRYVDNPNGSQADVAAVCDESGRVCGLMPHPERHVDPTHHPRWTRMAELPAEGEGLAVFRNAVRYFS